MKKKNNNVIMVSIGLIILFSLFMVFMKSAPSSNTIKITGKEFVEKYLDTKNAVLIDVRTPEEFASGHIYRAINIDFENQSFISEIKKLDTSKVYFVYCRSGNRSGKAISLMKDLGITSVYDLEGGIVSNRESLTLVTSDITKEEYIVDASDMLDATSLTSGVKKSEITEKEKAGLIQMREEEKLARDVYTTLGNIWGTRIFSNIASSEQTHTNAIKTLLVTYGIKDPVTTDTVGVFTSKTMQDLYTNLVEKGKVSLSEALIVGAVIEDLDIHDLDILKKETSKEDILLVYENLQKGSRNHMRAFVRSNGGSYVPTYISESEYLSIINSPQERGR